MTDSTVYIGIDPTGGSRAMTCAVLDEKLNIVSLNDGTLDDMIAIALAYPAAVCAIDAPSGRNKQLLTNPDYRQQVNLDPNRLNYTTYRVCEYELRQRGIYIYNTPPGDENLTDWILEGFLLYDRLRQEGYVYYPQASMRRMFETYPYAVFTVLAGARPYPKSSFEGLLQRQLILYEEGLNIPDPMPIMQEITRHRLRTGDLALDKLYSHDQLDALGAAYTAWLVDREPQNTLAVGDPGEGLIVVPTGTLQDSY